MNIIKLNNVSKRYKSTKVFSNFQFEVKRGEFSCLFGPSGIGKTTLLNLISGLASPDIGQISVLEYKISELNSSALARFRNKNIGMVHQFFNLIPYFSALDNVSIPQLISGSSQKQARAKAESVLDTLGLKDKFHSKPYQLSGGEQQRVAIARAVVNSAPLILADEPTGNLDYQASQQVIDIFKQLNKEKGCTILMASHDPLVKEASERIITL